MLFIDVFCGAGGFTEGLKMAGFTHICGIEIDKHAAATYAANNHGDVIVDDVRNVTMARLKPYIDKNGGAGSGKTRIDVLAGSPPCTSFSSAGPRKEGDERDDLYMEMIRLAKLLDPKVIVIENVVGMMTKRDPRRQNQCFADLVLQDFRKAGYHCRYETLSTLQFGLPQTRKRVVFIASKDEALIRFPKVESVEALTARDELVAVRTVLDPPEVIPPLYFFTARKIQYWMGNPYAKIIDMNKPSPTIRATYHRSQGEHALIRYVDGRMRRMTEKEVARVQGFPPGFVFVGSATQIYKQIGNAVAPPMARGIGLELWGRMVR